MSYIGSYVWQIRQKIGTDLLIVPGVCIVFENTQGEILLGLRTDFQCWSHFGGAVEVGQTVTETMLREAVEETGLRPTAFQPFGYYSATEPVVYPNGDRTQAPNLCFHVTAWEEVGQHDEEHSALQWFSLKQLPPLRPFCVELLAMLEKFKQTGTFQLN